MSGKFITPQLKPQFKTGQKKKKKMFLRAKDHHWRLRCLAGAPDSGSGHAWWAGREWGGDSVEEQLRFPVE